MSKFHIGIQKFYWFDDVTKSIAELHLNINTQLSRTNFKTPSILAWCAISVRQTNLHVVSYMAQKSTFLIVQKPWDIFLPGIVSQWFQRATSNPSAPWWNIWPATTVSQLILLESAHVSRYPMLHVAITPSS